MLRDILCQYFIIFVNKLFDVFFSPPEHVIIFFNSITWLYVSNFIFWNGIVSVGMNTRRRRRMRNRKKSIQDQPWTTFVFHLATFLIKLSTILGDLLFYSFADAVSRLWLYLNIYEKATLLKYMYQNRNICVCSNILWSRVVLHQQFVYQIRILTNPVKSQLFYATFILATRRGLKGHQQVENKMVFLAIKCSWNNTRIKLLCFGGIYRDSNLFKKDNGNEFS
jgi:hypothetical protein